jgi:tRNA U34 2-thiouridine synthase MnmA/TrmU
MPRSCVVLFSGGLDSILTLALLARDGIDCYAFHGVSAFIGKSETSEDQERIRAQCLALGARGVFFRNMTDEMVALTKNPCHGRGKYFNACLDCRVNTVGNALKIMAETGADFLASGEVIGQRPMSQRKDAIIMTDKFLAKGGKGGLLLRPLCAKNLDPTVPEKEGWVSQDCLFGFSGRDRTPQVGLAQTLGIADYPNPGGGCLLTDENYSARLRDLMEHKPDWDGDDARLLKLGRPLRLSPETVVIACRNDEENDLIETLAKPDEFLYVTETNPGAVILVRGRQTQEAELVAAGLAVYHSRNRREGSAPVLRWHAGTSPEQAHSLGIRGLVTPEYFAQKYTVPGEKMP